MPWLQLRLSATSENTETLSELLTEAGALAVTLRDAGDTPLLEPGPGETPVWPETIVIGLFEADSNMDRVIQSLSQSTGTKLQYQLEPLEDKDWERAWMDNYHPMSFGQRLWICPSWSTPPQPEAINLMLDPGLAFGTGTHPTTSLCLEWLDQHDITGLDVIDYGCGSGILAIAAALLGARHVWAIDHDPQALIATQTNAKQNRVQEKITVGRPDELPDLQSNLVLANILAGPLMALAPVIAEHTKSGGLLVLSGLLEKQALEVSTHYQSWFKLSAPRKKDDWVLLEGKKA
ncbi:MAG: 50S ribosomal protein L11 methyltransferase [Gammaproteobacteria bacterium]|nr:50S ribosomal protein L11 methyltransferase [Gammaproteobacteria bacterium]